MAEKSSFPFFNGDEIADIAVVGGGITGVTAAYLLSQNGKKVVLLKAENIGGSTTGYSTGDLYAPVSVRLSGLESKFGKEVIRHVAKSRAEVIDFIKKTINHFHINCHFIKTSLNLFTQVKASKSEIEKEHEAVLNAGLGSSLLNSLSLPFSKFSRKN